MCVCKYKYYVKIRRHQHTRVHAHTGPRLRHANARAPACCVLQTQISHPAPRLAVRRQQAFPTQTTIGIALVCVADQKGGGRGGVAVYAVRRASERSGVVSRACSRAYARVLTPPNIHIHIIYGGLCMCCPLCIINRLCGMPACGPAVGCGVCDTPELWSWSWSAAGLCARVRVCAGAA